MSKKRRAVEEFKSIFQGISQQQREPMVLVGGHAVNVWALMYEERLGAQLKPLQPLTSSDLDFCATRNALITLSETLDGKLLLSGPRELTEGTLILGRPPDVRQVDVLRRVHGLPPITKSDSILLTVCGYEVPVLLPHLLLQAKLANAVHLDQAERQDVKHVRIMALALREFLRDVIHTTAPSDERTALSLLQRIAVITTSEDARQFTRQFKQSFEDVLPESALASTPLPKLHAFTKDELPRIVSRWSGKPISPPQSSEVRSRGRRR